MAGQALSWNSISLQTNNIITQNVVHESIPTKDAKLYTLAHASGSVVPFTSYPSKTITVTGRIYSDNITDFDLELDTFRSYFSPDGTGNLDIAYAGSTRRYICIVNALSIDRPGGLDYADFSITFIAVQPFGQDVNSTTLLSASGRTNAQYTDLVTFSGTAPWQKPIITITYATASGSGNVTFGNNSNGQSLTISGTRSNGDVITFDSRNKSVQVNYADIDFTGAFPEFPPGLGSLAYSDGLGSRNFSVSVAYYPLYF